MYIYISKYVCIFRVFKFQIAPILLDTQPSGLWMYLYQVVPMTQLRASVEKSPLEGTICHFHDYGRKGNNWTPLKNDLFFHFGVMILRFQPLDFFFERCGI